MDDQEFSGTAAEFLSIVSDDGPDSASPTLDTRPTPKRPASAAPEAATDSPDAEEDDGLSPQERVAAVLAQDAEGTTPEPAAIAEPDGDDADEDDDGNDLDAGADETPDLDQLTPEQLRQLAEEALENRAKEAETNVDAEHQQFVAEIQALDARVTQQVQQRFEREVIAVGDAHYDDLRAQEAVKLFIEAQEKDNPEAYFNAHLTRRQAPITRAQRAWEMKKAAEWEPVVEQSITAARKQHPALRQRYAAHLVDHFNLPKRATDELLKVQNTDDMPVVAESLAASVKAHAKQKRQANQQQRDAAAKERSRHQITPPVTGKPASRKPVELKGTAEEWLALRAS